LQAIAKENWDSPYVLEKIAHELSLRDSSVERKDVWELYESVLRRLKKLESIAKMQPEDGKLWLQLQEIEQLRYQAEKTGYFKWPTTFAPIGDGELNADGWHEEGLLSCIGYHVGNDGKHPHVRHYLLDWIFHKEELPKVKSEEYMNEFGTPKSPQRLHKMANILASMARDFKRNYHADYSQAISDYETDLEYLYDKYYVDEFHFAWPRT